jgi:hypothetical protein
MKTLQELLSLKEAEDEDSAPVSICFADENMFDDDFYLKDDKNQDYVNATAYVVNPDIINSYVELLGCPEIDFEDYPTIVPNKIFVDLALGLARRHFPIISKHQIKVYITGPGPEGLDAERGTHIIFSEDDIV